MLTGVVSLASKGARHSCKKGKYASVCIMSNIRNSMKNYYVNASGYTTPPMVTYDHKTLNSEMEKFQKPFMVWQITDDQMKKCSMYHFLVPEPHLYSCDYCDLITSIFLHCKWWGLFAHYSTLKRPKSQLVQFRRWSCFFAAFLNSCRTVIPTFDQIYNYTNGS